MDELKVILIEDDELLHTMYKDKLTKAGYHVYGALDGEEATKLIQNNNDAAIVLLDVILPNVHGVDILKSIKESDKTKSLSVVMLTNLGDEGIIQDALNLGARDYLKKEEVPPEELAKLVKRYITNPHYTTRSE